MNLFRYICIFLPLCILADDRLRLNHADMLENITVKGQAIQILTGNVKFTKRNMVITCDRAKYREKTGQGSMTGKTKVIKEELTLTCDSLHFDSPNDILKTFGSTHIWDKDYDLFSDSLNYFTELNRGEALGNARLKQKDQIITADLLHYEKAPESDAVSYEAIGHVIIQEEERTATCGKAIYSQEKETTHLYLDPQVETDTRTLSGSKIELQYSDEELEYMYIPSKAHVVSVSSGWQTSDTTNKSTSRDPIHLEDNMTGKVLKGFFVDGGLDSMRVEGMATTLYHIFEDSVYQGKNQASGDTMTILLQEKDLHQILIAGGGRGAFTPDPTNKKIDAPIVYKSDNIEYNIPDETTNLHTNAEIQHTDMNLSAGFLNINWQTNLLKAFPISPVDTTLKETRPTMKEAGKEPMSGDEMVYNLNTRRGKIIKGKTKTKDGYYHGNEIRNQADDTFYVKNSIYSTCDLDIPHFHFGGQKMKMIHNDKVVSRPLIFYIGGIPLFPLPFAIFPHQSGNRNSGWLMPSYGETSNRGQFLDGLGYYWAFSDYLDTKVTTSFADRQGFFVKVYNRYKKRYWYTGNFQFETRQNFKSSLPKADRDISHLNQLERTTDYNIRWSHNHTLRNDQSLRVDASYYSRGDFNRETGIDLSQRLEQQAISKATYSKRWKKSKNSLSMNFQLKQDLMAERKIDSSLGNPFFVEPTHSGYQLNKYSGTLPSISFRHGQSQLFPTKLVRKRWYHNISWNYSSSFTNKLRTYFETVQDPNPSDPPNYIWNEEDTTIYDGILTHNFSLNAPQKLFKYITVSPRLSLKSSWVNKSFDAYLDSETNNKESIERTGLAMRTTGSLGLSLRTQLYGLFPINIAEVKNIRHVMTPSVGYSYTPDFSKPLFGMDLGYFQTIIDTAGNEILHDRFSGTMAGGTPKTERQSMNISVNNVFQAKVKSLEEEKKIDLFSWRVSTSYNFVAEEFQLANLQSSIRTKIGEKLSLDIRMTHDFYKYNFEEDKRINTFNKNENGLIIPRLINAQFSTGFGFSGRRHKWAGETTPEEEEDSLATEETEGLGDFSSFPSSQSSTGGDKLWNTNVSLSYSYNNANPDNPLKSFWMNTSSSIQITKYWRVNYNARFDLESRDMVNHGFSIYRDLHCWEMSINWTPSGFGQGIYLKINVKSPTLEDLKFEQRGGIFQRRANF